MVLAYTHAEYLTRKYTQMHTYQHTNQRTHKHTHTQTHTHVTLILSVLCIACYGGDLLSMLLETV